MIQFGWEVGAFGWLAIVLIGLFILLILDNIDKLINKKFKNGNK